MADIVKIIVEMQPKSKFIGKKYTDKDRNEFNSFSNQWQEWFANGYFKELEKLEGMESMSDDYIGFCKLTETGFEYWIGCFMGLDDETPEGYEDMIVEGGKVGVCYIYGKEDTGELYGIEPHNKCLEALKEKNYKIKDPCAFERYNCPRFTTPDEKGNVILDYCFFLED